MAEIKQALKDAKKAMKENNFEEVSKQCKAALKHDRKNYNALVLFGRACQELGRLGDSKKALMMATQVDSESPVAWQGLAVLCDKQPDITTHEETITIYTRLKDFVKDDNDKLDSMYRKIATVYLEKEEPLSAAATLRELVTRLNEPAKVTEAWRSIAQILSGTKDLPEEEAPKLEEALEHLLNESVLGENESNYQSYLRILYRLRKFPKLIVAAQNMLNIFPTYYPLEWICRTFVEMNAFPVDGEDKFPLSQEELSEYNLKLLTMNKASPWGNLAMGLTCKLENKPEEAKAYLRVGAERVSNNLLGWRLLLIVQEKINDWPGVEVSCKKIINILNSESKVTLPDNEDAESYSIKMHLMQAKALFYMGHMNHLKQAVAILDKLSGTDLESGILLVRSRIKLKEFNEAMDEIERLQSAHGKQPRLKLLLAILHRSRGESQEALQLLLEYVEEEPSVGEGHLELGRLYFEMGDLKKAQLCCMRAGKLDPTLGQAFLYLGHFFRRQDNMPKALKCYEKALSINPCDDDTGAALSDMYRILGEHDANIRLLRRVTSEAGRASCAWAWLRLGLHHLALHEYDKAIQAFHCTLTINPNDSASYECLGDAYLAYGAHTAALKVFTKAAEINPNALYPLYQIAHIKQMVGENLEAIADYEAVLERDPIPAVQVVSLVGLAEALIADARKSYEQFFHKNVKDDCVRAIPHLMRAASIKPESSSIWKLLGDACSLLFPIPPSLATFTVPAKLMDREVEDLQEMVDVDKLQVLQLGARCYAVALQIASNDASLWHDLAVNTYLQGHVMERDKGADEAAVKSLMERSLAALRKSLALEPTSGKIWNSLGLVASHKAVGELKLAQHALIKSTEYQPTAVNWTHLGGFYLVHEEPRLAHEAFSVAQALDPSFVTCWVGQALVAEAVGHYEAFDLFRHTTMLGIQVESCMGYTHHVSQLACDVTNEKKSRVQESVKQALPKVSDCMVYYTTEEERDPVGLNMAGLMLEMIGLYQSAAKAYEMALTALSESDESDTKFLDGVHCNLGRTLTAQGLVEEAMQQYSAIKEPDYFTQCGLALASLKAGKFEEAYNAYTAALHWLAPDDTQKSHILVALASLQYKFQNSEEAKKLLFQGSQLKGASVRGLFALAALGLVSGDAALTGAALAELRPHEHNPEYVHHVTFLRAAEATARSNMKEAKLILSKAIHQHPANAPLWQSLARHLLTMTTSSPASSQNNCVAAAACAASATRLAQAAGQHKTIAQDSVASVLATLASEGSKINQSRASLREAQRAVLMCPGSAEAWAMLVAARVAAGHAQRHQDVVRLAKMWAQQAPPKVAKWLNGITRQYARVA